MSTRSTIAMEYGDGSIEQVYCHFDGYLEGIGAQLINEYSNPFEVRDLIGQGDMSKIGEPYTNRGEELNIRKYKNITDYCENCQQEEYDYILRNIDGAPVWFVRFYKTKGDWVSMEMAVKMKP
jgi:hypothetical protein